MSLSAFMRPLFWGLQLFVFMVPASAQSWQETLTGQTTSERDRFGASLARAEGEVFVGAPRDSAGGGVEESGSVTLFTRGATGWLEESVLLPQNQTVEGHFGASLSLEGERILVGAPGEDSLAGFGTGGVSVFKKGLGGWSLETSLEAGGLMPGDRFGYSVAIDGDIAVVGAPGRDQGQWNSGAVYLFRETTQGWLEDGELVAPPGSGGARFGHAVALRGDTLVVGAPENSNTALARGAAYVYTRDDQGLWSFETELIAEEVGELQRFGLSVAIGPSMITVGGPGSYESYEDIMEVQSTSTPTPLRGLVCVFRGVGGEWPEVQRLRAPAGAAGDLFGQRMCLSAGLLSVSSGGRLTGAGPKGATFYYEESGEGWLLNAEISDPSTDAGGLFGAVAVHGDGEAFLSGIHDGALGTQAGCVQVFEFQAQGHQYCFGLGCPCGNADPEAGCMNSTGGGAELFALGSGSLSEDDLVLGAKGLPAGVPVLVFYSSAPTHNFFGDGLLCVGGATLSGLSRVGRPRRALSGGDMRWGPGLLSVSGIQAVAGRLHFQAIYRDPSSFCGTGVNLSNALSLDLIP